MRNLLIIEDDPYVQRVYTRLFEHEDYKFEIASDGEEGLAKVRKFKPALILLDIIMPKKNGLEVLEELKKDPELRDIPVVILTNLDEKETMKKALDLGADSFMIKADFDPEQVKEKIDKYLEEDVQ